MSTPDRPNILWISLEDTTPRFGCYGDPIARTPNIDRLAAGGCRFPNAFSTVGVCAPSRSEFGDMGNISEEQMVATWYPNGTQPQTASPLFIPINAPNPGMEPAHEDGELDAPLLLQLYCSTQGASIAYTTEQGEDVRWQLYTEPLRLPKGETVLRAKATRNRLQGER